MKNKDSKPLNQRESFGLISFLIFGGFILVTIILSLYAQDESAFTGKTIWDWLDLLLVPILFILLLPAANWVVRKAQERHAFMQREIALDDQREKALQSYMELITDLLLEKGLGSQENRDE
jgi:hypothetical protein